jgi:hypothetical protein
MAMKEKYLLNRQTLLRAVKWVWLALLVGLGIFGIKQQPPPRMATIPPGLHAALTSWAMDNGGAYPNEPGDANASFRLLFRAGLLGSEEGFGTPGDGWCGAGKPDGDIGTAPDFAKALEPGELSIIYVAGLDQASDSQSILLIAGIRPDHAGITAADAASSEDAGPLQLALLALNGSAKVWDPYEHDPNRRGAGGNWLAWLANDFGIDARNFRLPARK